MTQLTLDNISDGAGVVVCGCGSKDVQITSAPGRRPAQKVECLGCGSTTVYEAKKRRGRVVIDVEEMSP